MMKQTALVYLQILLMSWMVLTVCILFLTSLTTIRPSYVHISFTFLSFLNGLASANNFAFLMVRSSLMKICLCDTRNLDLAFMTCYTCSLHIYVLYTDTRIRTRIHLTRLIDNLK